MTKKKKDNPVSMELCEAYRKVLEEKIKGLKTSIVVGVTASTTIIVLVQFLLSLQG